MILRTKPYALNVKYIPGSHLVPADALSRASLLIEAAHQPDEIGIHLLSYGHVDHAPEMTAETGKDLELQQLHKVVMSGWPRTKEETPVEDRPY